jgi:hypothetical protein
LIDLDGDIGPQCRPTGEATETEFEQKWAIGSCASHENPEGIQQGEGNEDEDETTPVVSLALMARHLYRRQRAVR